MVNEEITEVESSAEVASPVDELVMLQTYKSSATPEQREQKIKFMSFQLSMIKEQAGWGITANKTTVKCGCQKKVKLIYAYRCLYCGIWYCRECAQEHFGYKVV